ncbi:MAG: ankyrin repeat domain-containing protein [Alphaproteobacteria bacterium]|nr:ankyrin repeat domain-containing protein [Alphaproteobacteria bacterium]
MGKYSGGLIALLLALYGAVFALIAAMPVRSGAPVPGAAAATAVRWEPRLIVNNDEQLCRAFHSAVLVDFRSETPIDVVAAFAERPAPSWPSELPNTSRSAPSTIEFYESVLLGPDRRGSVIRWNAVGRLFGNDVYSTDRAQVVRAIQNNDGPFFGDRGESGSRIGEVRDTSRLLPGQSRQWATEPLQFEGRFYFIVSGPMASIAAAQRIHPSPMVAAVMTADPILVQCLSIIREWSSVPPPGFAVNPTIDEFVGLLRSAGGTEPATCRPGGTSTNHPHVRTDEHFGTTLHLALHQPWRLRSTDREPSEPNDEAGIGLADSTDDFAGILRLWSFEDPVNRRQYLHLVDAYERATMALAARYRIMHRASPDQSMQWARDATWRLLRQRIGSISPEYRREFWSALDRILMRPHPSIREIERAGAENAGSGLRINRSDVTTEAQNQSYRLSRLALAGARQDTLESLAGNNNILNARGAVYPPAITYSLAQPATLRWFIARGADVNARNPFGKTPLMYAAHLDLPDAIRALLAAGADVNAATFAEASQEEQDACWYSIRFRRRTALMYAAENGSLETIRILLEAGADRAARDSGGRGIFDYLSRNTVLDERGRAEARRLLSAAP